MTAVQLLHNNMLLSGGHGGISDMMASLQNNTLHGGQTMNLPMNATLASNQLRSAPVVLNSGAASQAGRAVTTFPAGTQLINAVTADGQPVTLAVGVNGQTTVLQSSNPAPGSVTTIINAAGNVRQMTTPAVQPSQQRIVQLQNGQYVLADAAPQQNLAYKVVQTAPLQQQTRVYVQQQQQQPHNTIIQNGVPMAVQRVISGPNGGTVSLKPATVMQQMNGTTILRPAGVNVLAQQPQTIQMSRPAMQQQVIMNNHASQQLPSSVLVRGPGNTGMNIANKPDLNFAGLLHKAAASANNTNGLLQALRATQPRPSNEQQATPMSSAHQQVKDTAAQQRQQQLLANLRARMASLAGGQNAAQDPAQGQASILQNLLRSQQQQASVQGSSQLLGHFGSGARDSTGSNVLKGINNTASLGGAGGHVDDGNVISAELIQALASLTPAQLQALLVGSVEGSNGGDVAGALMSVLADARNNRASVVGNNINNVLDSVSFDSMKGTSTWINNNCVSSSLDNNQQGGRPSGNSGNSSTGSGVNDAASSQSAPQARNASFASPTAVLDLSLSVGTDAFVGNGCGTTAGNMANKIDIFGCSNNTHISKQESNNNNTAQANTLLSVLMSNCMSMNNNDNVHASSLSPNSINQKTMAGIASTGNNGNKMSDLSTGQEDLSRILTSIGADLARRGIPIDMAVEAGWLGAVGNLDVAVLKAAYTNELNKPNASITASYASGHASATSPVNASSNAECKGLLGNPTTLSVGRSSPAASIFSVCSAATPQIPHNADAVNAALHIPDSQFSAFAYDFFTGLDDAAATQQLLEPLEEGAGGEEDNTGETEPVALNMSQSNASSAVSWKQSSVASGSNSTAGDNKRVNAASGGSSIGSGVDVQPELASRFANLDLGCGFY